MDLSNSILDFIDTLPAPKAVDDAREFAEMVQPGEDLWSEDPARELNNQISELQARVAFPQHWSSGEHQQHIEKLRQLSYEKSRLTDRSDASPMERTHH